MTKKKIINKDINFKNLELEINYKFTNLNLLTQSMTHKSYSYNFTSNILIENNEKLEFLGDSILNFISTLELFKSFKNFNEGELSEHRAAYICQSNLAKGASKIKIYKYIRASRAMKDNGEIYLPRILSNTLEALIGAIYLDGGIKSATMLIRNTLGNHENEINIAKKNPKNILQEKIQSLCKLTPIYLIKNCSGAAHNPNFYVGIYINKIELGLGNGKSKKIATKNCAINVLKIFSKINFKKINK